MTANLNIERFRKWVTRHKTLVLSLPILLLLCTFFVVENVKGFRDIGENPQNKSGFNTNIPGDSPEKITELKEEAFGQKSYDNSISDPTKEISSPELLEREREEDSLRQALKQLEGLSFSPDNNTAKTALERQYPKTNLNQESRKHKRQQLEEQLNYTQLLREGKEKMLESSGGSAPKIIDRTNEKPIEIIRAKVKVYKDQFILPDERVQLILAEEIRYRGSLIPKNTFFYAMSRVQGNRVLLEVDNINHIPIIAELKDDRDGMPGIYSKRAGELWGEYVSGIQSGTTNELSQQLGNELDGNLSTLVRGLGSFLERKRLKERDKILLINGHELLMTVE